MSGEPDRNTPLRLTVGDLRMIVGDIATSTKRFVSEMIEGAVQPLHQEIRELTERVQALESVKAHYCGVWERGTPYEVGSFVTFRNSLWAAREASRGVPPGSGLQWQLAARAGKDGRDRKDLPDAVR